LKLGPPGSEAKWGATRAVYRLARSAELPVPELVYFGAADEAVHGWTVRVLTWMEGASPEAVLGDARRSGRFFADLGAVLRGLHDLPTNGFSSRLDGSAPSFSLWSDYVRWRLPRVLDRVREVQAFPSSEATTIAETIESLANEVDPSARPSICHRDLYLDNVLATDDGRVAALLDFDGAEAWDPAIDVVKLRWLVFPRFPESELAFKDGYGEEPMWDRRVLLAELLELLNAVPNAVKTGDADFEISARERLQTVLAD
jgi:aminoglycoside phosphotransferase (APT) family kinase protein